MKAPSEITAKSAKFAKSIFPVAAFARFALFAVKNVAVVLRGYGRRASAPCCGRNAGGGASVSRVIRAG
jgi:hypothetical protein